MIRRLSIVFIIIIGKLENVCTYYSNGLYLRHVAIRVGVMLYTRVRFSAVGRIIICMKLD